jgi:hypothetical protein
LARLYSYIDTTDDTSLEDVGFVQKAIAIIFQWFKESGRESAERDKLENIVSEDLLTLQADLIQYIDKALEPIKQGKKRKVTLSIDSNFVPVLESSMEKYKSTFNIDYVSWPKVDYKYNYQVIVSLEAK